MTYTARSIAVIALISAGIAASTLPAVTQEKMPFGDKKDVNFSVDLWAALNKANMVGADRMNSKAFEGSEPHGAIQQVLAADLTVRGRKGRAIVKMNHMGGEGVTVDSIYAQPDKYLAAYTVMFKREKGYDAENKDWFWAKFNPKGSLDEMNPGGPKMAGRIAKGMSDGCIACHTGGGGADLEFLTPD